MRLPLKNVPISVIDGYLINESDNYVTNYLYNIAEQTVENQVFKDVDVTDDAYVSNGNKIYFKQLEGYFSDTDNIDELSLYKDITVKNANGELTRLFIHGVETADEGIYSWRVCSQVVGSEEIGVICYCGLGTTSENKRFYINTGSASYSPETKIFSMSCSFFAIPKNGYDGVGSFTIGLDDITTTYSNKKYTVKQTVERIRI